MPPPLPTNLNQQNPQPQAVAGTAQFHQQHILQQQQNAIQATPSSSNQQISSIIIPQQQHINTAAIVARLQQQQIATTSAALLNAPSTSDATANTQINTFRSYVTMLADNSSSSKDDLKRKAAQELNENFEFILQSPEYPKFLDHCIKNFLKILSEGQPLFISEYNIQQMRKLLLEMIHRFPTNNDLKPYCTDIWKCVLKLLHEENEENTLVCLRIIIELHKVYRPKFNSDTQKFLQFVKSIYSDLENHLHRIFEPRPVLKVKDLSSINVKQHIEEIFTVTTIQTESKSQDGNFVSYNLIPKGTRSLKVLQELPIIVVLFYQIHKDDVKEDICDYIKLIMNTITLQPTLQQRQSPSFNREVFVDFMGAQIKTLSFIAYIIRSHHADVAVHSQQMVQGILGLLELCPQEVCHLRKELLIAIRHIVATDLKKKFVPHMERLFDENILLGNGWTVRDTLRPLAYSTLADLVHHVRQDLPLKDLQSAVHLFGKIVHDPTLNTTIQTMSCKLLLNLVDCIKTQSKCDRNAPLQCRQLLMRMLEVFVLKFKTFAKLQLPVLVNKSKPQNVGQTQQIPDPKESELRLSGQTEPPEKSKFGFPQQQMSYNVADYRNLVKTLVCGVKTITWGCSSITITETTTKGEQISTPIPFTPKDTLVFIRLVRWAMKALDIYQVQLPSMGGMAQFQGRPMHGRMIPGQNQSGRTQEEKEVLEHFSGVFSLMSTSVFRDVFSTCISYMVERIHQNIALQTIANSFLGNPHTSAVFATVLVEFLLERMSEMGSSIDRSNLYLRLFKVVFGSVTLFKDNEHMLKPHLHQIVNRSMELSTSAREPYNYFVLLRTLFRSIGGGSHDLLYEVFLPLLPNLLEGLNRLQSGLHKPHMKDLFVELCLTVPVRLSSLLPYLPMLMDPLVSALNGSHTLVSQGLRTLELCVDNLQPEFLYEHIQPVRADLMQALWRTLRNPDQVAHVAFRVLGKFGGGNRKMMTEPQKLEYNDSETLPPAILVYFEEIDSPIKFPVDKIIETAVNALKSSTTDSFYHKQCWEVIRCYLSASLNLTDKKNRVLALFLYDRYVKKQALKIKEDPDKEIANFISEIANIPQTSYQKDEILGEKIEEVSGPLYKCLDKSARKTHLTALTGMFVAAAIKELRQDVQPRMVSLVTHYTMVAIAQQDGPFRARVRTAQSNTFLDPLILIDALAVIMAHEEKELCKPGCLALGLILDTATNILGSKEKACQLPLMDYLKERMCALCYDRAWYSKLGGCIAIKFLFERMAPKWVYQHLYTFLKALMFVMMDLTGEVSSGALDMAKANMRKMLTICITPVDAKIATKDLLAVREKALEDVTSGLLSLVRSPHTIVREQAMYCIRVLAGCCGRKSANETFNLNVLTPHLDVVNEILSSGTVELTKETVEKIASISQIATVDPKLKNIDLMVIREKQLIDCSGELTRYVLSPNCDNKEHATYCLRVLAMCKGLIQLPRTTGSLPAVMTPHLEVLKFILKSNLFMSVAKVIQGHVTNVAKIVHSHIEMFKSGVPNWASDPSKLTFDNLIVICCTQMYPKTSSSHIINARDRALADITTELIRIVCDEKSTYLMKEQARYAIRVFAEFNGTSGGDDGSVASIIAPHVDIMKDFVPPTKLVGSPTRLQLIQQPPNAQVGLMDGNTFCMTLAPRLFTFDLKTEPHKAFFDELLLLLKRTDDNLTKFQCYKNVNNLVMLRKAAMRCISAYQRLPDESFKKVFIVLYNALDWDNEELQETAYECMHKFIANYPFNVDFVQTTMKPFLELLGDSRHLTLNYVKHLSYLTKLFPDRFHEKLCNQLLQHIKEFLENLSSVKKVTKNGENEQKIALIILIFHRITSATSKFIPILCELVLENEKQLLVEASSSFREPLMKFLLKYPGETLDLFLKEAKLKDPQWNRYLIYLIKHADGKPFRDHLQTKNVPTLAAYALIFNQQQVPTSQLTVQDKYELRHQAIRIISLLIKFDTQWIATQTQIIDALKTVWCDDTYQELHIKVEQIEITHWNEPKLIVKILLKYFEHDPNQIELLFELLRAFCYRFISDFQFLRDFLEHTVAQNYTIEWKRQAFFKFVEVFKLENISASLKSHIVQLILIPCFSDCGTGNMNALIGNDQPDQNVVSMFIYNVIDQKQSFQLEDCLRIALLQFACLLVEQASHHIHDTTSNKQQGNKIRKLMTFAWPCLLGKNCVDATTKYHGHLLLVHIIEKFAIHKKIVLQVFLSLVKAHAQEARTVVKQALEILTPAMPNRMEDDNVMLIHWTKKIIVEEGHSVQQLYHILQLVVRHYKVYYPVRHHLIQYIINSINRLGFSQTSTLDHKKMAVELAEVIIKWELERLKNEEGIDLESGDKKRMAGSAGQSISMPATPKTETDPKSSQPIEAVINVLLRLACQVNESTNSAIPIQQTGGTPGEILSKRCVTLLKTAFKPELWPQKCDLKLDEWFNNVFLTVSAREPNYANISTALELLCFLLTVLKEEQILNIFAHLQTGLNACLHTKETKVINLVQILISKLVILFPIDLSGANFTSQHDKLKGLYGNIGTMIAEGLRNYDQTEDTKPSSSSLFGPLMILKACCTKNPACIDKIITPFMKVLQKMTKEHLTPISANDSSPTDKLAIELLILSLDLVKTRVVVMSGEQRKTFIGTILVGLIEKTQDIKVMRAITRMLEEWIKKCQDHVTLSQAPSLREKSILLVKLMQYVEKRFPDDVDLNTQFLDLVHYVYTDEQLRQTELSTKLQSAFMSGLRCTVKPAIRAKFFHVLSASMPARLPQRLLYISSTQSWDTIGPHYWIKQCIEIVLATTVDRNNIQMAPNSALLPSVESVIQTANAKERDKFIDWLKENPIFTQDALISGTSPHKQKPEGLNAIEPHVAQQADYLTKARDIKTSQFIQAAIQLCHMDTTLAERVWLDIFPRMWAIMQPAHQKVVGAEMGMFVASGAHLLQKDCHPSALNTFTEAMTRCNPPIPIKPMVMKYLAKSHNLWHRMTLDLEQIVFDPNLQKQKREDCYDFPNEYNLEDEPIDALGDMYELLCEEDMWAGLWQKRSKFCETTYAIAFEQHGFFESAQRGYDACMERFKTDHQVGSREVRLWENRYIRCAKELNQWDVIVEYAAKMEDAGRMLILDSTWRVPSWQAMKEALSQVELTAPKEMAWKLNLYRGYIGVCGSEDRHIAQVDRCVELASGLCMREWRRYPHIVSHAHIPLLQAAQQIIELQEASTQIYQRLAQQSQGSRTPLDDMKAIAKTWKNRLPVIADDLSHWSDIFTWRQHHYKFITEYYKNLPSAQNEPQRNPATLGIHSSAQAIIYFAKIARKQNLTTVCLESLNRIYTIPLVLVADIFQNIRQQVKCHLNRAANGGNKVALEEGYKVVEKTDIRSFTPELKAEYCAMKGLILANLGKSDEANKEFSAAVQLHDTLGKAWAYWGDYLEMLFIRDRTYVTTGVYAMTCFLSACRNQSEPKARKYLAKVLWLLAHDDMSSQKLMKALETYNSGVPALQWLPWIPQLISCLVQYPGDVILNLLTHIARVFPQAVYFPMRTLYLTKKIEQLVGHIHKRSGNEGPSSSQDPSGSTQQPQGPPTTQNEAIKATPSLLRCTNLLKNIRDMHPIVLQSLECFVEEMSWFRETWYEEVLRQLRQCLAKCYAVAFENRARVNDVVITKHISSFVNKMVSTFGTGIENTSGSASESMAGHIQATNEDPVFPKIKKQFTQDFDAQLLENMKLHSLITKLKKWVKILESKAVLVPTTLLVEEKCRFLLNFNLRTAEVELPGEFLLPKHPHYFVRIARFMPKADIVQKHNTAARRIYIRGHNGKIYPYLVLVDGLGDGRREERVLQLLRMLNYNLGKQKETAKRFLHFTVPRVVAVSPQIRLVEDNPASISLLDIFKKGCAKLNTDHNVPISTYYERLANAQLRGQQVSHPMLRDILKSVQAKMVPKSILRNWALQTFPSATDYWTFRKMFTLQLALASFSEYVLYLTKLNPDMMYLHQDSGLINVSYFKFDVDDSTGELDCTRPVPFRLTPNIIEFIGQIGVNGPLTASMIEAARCLVQPHFKVQSILRAILKDELIPGHKKKFDAAAAAAAAASDGTTDINEKVVEAETDHLIGMVNKAVNAIAGRLNSLATFNVTETKVSTLVKCASTQDNLCRMDPTWHPWL